MTHGVLRRAGSRWSATVAWWWIALSVMPGLADATIVTDNFNRANGALGASWTVNVLGTAPPQIVSNQAQEAAGNYGEAEYTASSFGGNQFSEVQYVSGLTNGVINLVVRARQYTLGGQGDSYIGQLNGFGTLWKIFRVDNDVETLLTSGVFAPTNGDTYYFEANGSTLTLKRNGTTLGSATDATYSTGNPGLGIYDDGVLTVDNWRGGDTDTTAPTVPTGLAAAVISSSQINLSWTASTDTGGSGLAGYRVERCAGASCTTFAQIATPTTNSYNDTGLTAGTTYRYRVRAVDAAGNLSAYSTIVNATTTAPDTTAPTTPAGLAAAVISTTQINLSWTASTDTGGSGLAGYRVERCSGASCTTFVQIAAPTTNSYNDTGLTASTTYRYRVRAVDGATNLSAYSSIVNATTVAPDTIAPSTPTGLAAAVVSSTQINLSWTASTDTGGSGLVGYRVERCLGATCTTFAQIGTPTTTSYSDSGLSSSSTYRYRVRAVDGAGNFSAYSSIVNTTTSADTVVPTTPTGLVATAISSTQINLSWTASTDSGGSGLAGYRVDRCTGGSCTTFAQIATPTAISYSDTGLSASTSYSYRVRAVDGASNLSAYSATASVATSATGTIVTDNFNRANGALGANWTVNVLGTAPLQIVSNQAQEAAGNYGEAEYTASSFGGNQFSEVQYVSGLTNGVINLVVRARQYTLGGQGDGYIGQLNGFGTLWKIFRVDNDVETLLTSGTFTPTNSDTYYFEAYGSTLTLKRNGTTLGTATDATYTTGNPGLGIYDAGVLTVDNWRGGDITTDTTAPTAPTGLSAAVISSTQINLSWVASTDTGGSGLAGYRVERCSGASCTNFAQIATPTTNSYSDSGLAASTSYSYRVRAVDGASNVSGYSTTASATTQASGDTTAPSTPTSLAAAAISTTQINLSWTASTDNVAVTGYRVERCTGAGCSNFAQVGTPTSNAHNDVGLSASTTYVYRVRAVDGAGNLSAYSLTATATTLASAGGPSTPLGLSASPVSAYQINLSWIASTGTVSAASYQVERCMGAGCSNFTLVASPTTTFFNDTGLALGTTYGYRIRAVSSGGSLSNYSNSVSVTTGSGVCGP